MADGRYRLSQTVPSASHACLVEGYLDGRASTFHRDHILDVLCINSGPGETCLLF